MVPQPLKNRFYYGWAIVGVSFATLLVVFGIRLSFSVFFVALIDDFGWNRADTSLIFSVSMLTFALTSTLAGIALDRWGARRVFGLGILLLAFGLYLSSRIQSYGQLLVAYGFFASLGITILGLGPQAAVISHWFKQKRGLAIGIAFAGTGLGTLILTPTVAWIISLWDWRTAYLILAGIVILGFPFNIILLRPMRTQESEHPDQGSGSISDDEDSGVIRQWRLGQVVRTQTFWLLMLAALGAIGPLRMLTVHQLAVIKGAGFDPKVGALILGWGGVVTAITFISMGSLSDRYGRTRIYLVGSIFLIGAVIVLGQLNPNSQIIWVWIYALLFGVGEGSRSSLVTATASDLFPGKALGAVNGAVGAAFGLGAAIFPWIAGKAFDLSGEYTSALILGSIGIGLSTWALWLARKFKSRSEKRGSFSQVP